MAWIPLRKGSLAVLFALSLSFSPLCSQEGNRPQAPVDRERMWPAPTAEDWARPCLITFQRTWEDALAVSKETGKPILVCVNMDGEIASEHYAGVRYRQPEIAALYEPYVCVIASVYRHNPRDYDDEGNRILCPRFGSVTCGEHIAIEPGLYEKFFEGKRIAPRHIMVELDGAEKYDVYYAWDTDSVFAAIREGIEKREYTAPPVVRGDRSLVERVASRDIRDREAVEKAYVEGDPALRRALLEAARANADKAPLGLLRLGVFGLDLENSKLAREALAQARDGKAVDLIAEALRIPMEAKERESLIAALERLGESSPRARTAAVIHRGLASRSNTVDVEKWTRSFDSGSASYVSATDWADLESRLQNKTAATVEHPESGTANLEMAEATLALAVDPETVRILSANRRTAPKFKRMMFDDALRAARKAEELGTRGWRTDAVIALSSYYLGELEESYRRAESAVEAMPSGAEGWNAMAVLSLFAVARQQAISKALEEKKDWPSEWLTDLHSVYAVLARHPMCSDTQVVAQYDFLASLGAMGQASRFLKEGLARFPDSWQLHARLRGRLLWSKGPEGLEAAYEEMLAKEAPPRNAEWFAGYASLVAAETHRRKNRMDEALGAYDRAIAHYERSIERNPDSKDTSDHYVALALAGRARIALERQDYDKALEEILASYARKPQAAASMDGFGLSPVDTGKMLRARLSEAKREELVARIDAAFETLDRIDPRLLELPAYEREVPDDRPRRGRGRRGR